MCDKQSYRETESNNSDEVDFDEFVEGTIAHIKFGYYYIDEINFRLIDLLTYLIITRYIRFDGEFKTICHEWEYKHRHSTGTEFQEQYIR